MDDRSLRRAGLDYHELASVKTHKNWPACLSILGARRTFAFTTKGAHLYTDVRFARDDVFVFGAETRGLSPTLLEEFPVESRLRLPMVPGNRSINLSNAVAVVVFEAWRQLGFKGSA
jgi:tRNA (cytidine/uridine-2'-O-)-methyltransferase